MNPMPVHGLRRMFPWMALLFFSAIAVLLWQAQNRHERQMMLHLLETTADQLRIRIEGLIHARIASLEILADRWVEREPPDFRKERFLAFAASLYRRYPGFTSLHWVDPEGTVRWVYPEHENSQASGKNVFTHEDPPYAETLKKAMEERHYAVTPATELYEGGTGFEVFLPLMHDDRLQGYLAGVFRMDTLLNISVSGKIFETFRVILSEGERPVYDSRNTPGKHGEAGGSDPLQVVREISFADRTWQLRLEPTRELRNAERTPNLAYLAFGLALSGGLALLLHQLIRRVELYKGSRDLALYEVSERKKAEDALRKNEKKLKAAMDELSAANVEMESFVYTVSHDLKTPIVTIEGFIGALREDYGQVLTGDAEKYLRYMSDAALKMESLINDLLNLSRIGRMTEEKTVFPMGPIVHQSLELLKPRIDARGIQVSVQQNLPEVYGESKRIAQALDNLLSNAVKYIGQDNPSPRIEIGVRKENGENIFYIRDNGMGIEETYFEKIFKIFQRLPSAKRVEEGTGMGLTIVKRIIEYHGGRIWLDSKPGEGTTFFFILGSP